MDPLALLDCLVAAALLVLQGLVDLRVLLEPVQQAQQAQQDQSVRKVVPVVLLVLEDYKENQEIPEALLAQQENKDQLGQLAPLVI